jgi:hypothetical protein
MEAGTHGETQLDSLWTHTTISIIVFKTISVGNGAILLHSMGHNQTWWLLREIRMMWKGISVLSILR